MIDADYADDLALLAHTPVHADPDHIAWNIAVESIGLNVNANKTEFKCLNQEEAISTL